MSLLFGIDLGGTKIEGVAIDPANKYKEEHRIRIDTEQSGGYEHIVNRIVMLVGQLEKEAGIRASRIGIGTPGAIDPDSQTLKNSNTTCLIGQPLQADLQKKLAKPVLMANDANCFALAETRMGIVPEIAPEAEVVFGVIMGTGVGGGIVVNNKVINGRHSIGGEWGHNYLEESGGPCYCGRIGCVEQVLSGPASERFYQQISGEKRKLKDIYARYLTGSDAFATKTINRLIEYFGKGLSVIINILDPDVIVIGGGVGNIDLLYSAGAKSVEKYIFNPVMQTKIVKPKLGDSAGVFGAAMLTEK
jgi:predicted NBD/HSP70 family sugar kinase